MTTAIPPARQRAHVYALPGPRVAWRPRRIPLSYAHHVAGEVPLAIVMRAVPFESQLERDAIVYLAGFSGLRFLQSQPFTVSYEDAGRRRRYTPDLLAVFDPLAVVLRRRGFAAWTVIEVKPCVRLEADRDAVLARLQAVAVATGMATVCLTEADVRPGRAS